MHIQAAAKVGAGGSDFSKLSPHWQPGPARQGIQQAQAVFIYFAATLHCVYTMVAECWEEGEEYVVMQHNVLEMWSFWSNSPQLFNGGQLGK